MQENVGSEEPDDPKMHHAWKELEKLLTHPNYVIKQKWRGHALMFYVAPRNPIYKTDELNRTMRALLKEEPTWVREFLIESVREVMHFGAMGFCSTGRHYVIGDTLRLKQGQRMDIDRMWYCVNFYPDVLHMERGFALDISSVPVDKLLPSRRVLPLLTNTTKEKLGVVGEKTRTAKVRVAETSSRFLEEQGRRTRNLAARVAFEVSNFHFPWC